MFSKFNVNKIALAVFLVLGLVTTTAYAVHSWANYHWARTSNPFTLKLVDNVGSAWDSHLATASSDWSQASVLDTTVVAGSGGKCRTVSGKVVVCAKTSGFNGILGTATIWITGGEHITQGRVQLNDTYFNTSTYNTTGWRSLVMCQEIGHTFGLGHQDENFNNPPITPHTCMDYFVPGTNEVVHPNQHDYDQLATIYNSHNDSFTTVGQIVPNGNRPNNNDATAEWGKSVKEDAQGRTSLFERDLGNGNKVFTFVFWAD